MLAEQTFNEVTNYFSLNGAINNLDFTVALFNISPETDIQRTTF